MIHLHLDETREQAAEDGQIVGFVDVAYPLCTRKFGRRNGQQFLHDRCLRQRGVETGVSNVDLIRLLFGIAVYQQVGYGNGVEQRGGLTEVREHRPKVASGTDHEIASLSTHSGDLHGDLLVQYELPHLSIQVGVHSSAEPPVGADHQQGDVLYGPHPQERLRR